MTTNDLRIDQLPYLDSTLIDSLHDYIPISHNKVTYKILLGNTGGSGGGGGSTNVPDLPSSTVTGAQYVIKNTLGNLSWQTISIPVPTYQALTINGTSLIGTYTPSSPVTINLTADNIGAENPLNKVLHLYNTLTTQSYPTAQAVNEKFNDYVAENSARSDRDGSHTAMQLVLSEYDDTPNGKGTYRFKTVSRDLTGVTTSDIDNAIYTSDLQRKIAPVASDTESGFMTLETYNRVSDNWLEIQHLMGLFTYVTANDFGSDNPANGSVTSFNDGSLSGWLRYQNPAWLHDGSTNPTGHIPHGLLIKNLYKDDGGGGSTGDGSNEWVYNWDGFVDPDNPAAGDNGGTWVWIGLFNITILTSSQPGVVLASPTNSSLYDGTLGISTSGIFLINGWDLVELQSNRIGSIDQYSDNSHYPTLKAVYDYVTDILPIADLPNKFLTSDLSNDPEWRFITLDDIPKTPTLQRVLLATSTDNLPLWGQINLLTLLLTTGILPTSKGGLGLNANATLLNKGAILTLTLLNTYTPLLPPSGNTGDGYVLTRNSTTLAGVEWAEGGGGSTVSVLQNITGTSTTDAPSQNAVRSLLLIQKVLGGSLPLLVGTTPIKFWAGSQSEYDQLQPNWDLNTLYMITA